MEAVSYVTKKLSQLNFFRDAKTMREADERVLRNQILATRVYLPLLFVSLLILILFTLLTQKTVSVTVPSPSLATYKRLQAVYLDKLSCPCRQIAITREDFLSIIPAYHQVCSSELVSSKWIASLFSSDTVRLTPLDFRLTAAAQFRLLAIFCWISQQTITDNYYEFIKGQFASARVLSPNSFSEEADALINKFYKTMEVGLTAVTATRLVTFVLTQSQLYSAINTDAFQLSVAGSNQYQTINNFYPNRDNVTFITVIFFEMKRKRRQVILNRGES